MNKALLLRQEDVNYTTVSPATGRLQCANCRFYSYLKYDPDGSTFLPSSCQIVEPYPLDIMPTGWCDRHEVMPADMNEPLEVVIVAENDDMDVEERGYIAPLPADTSFIKRLIGRRNPPQTLVYRGNDGLRLGLIVTSNGYKDRENEHVSTKALEEYVKASYNDAGKWVGDNRLMFWHRLDMGDVIAAAIIKGFLVEVVKERAGIVPEALWDYWQKTSEEGSVVWGASHGFKSVKRMGDTYQVIRKKETTVLPVEVAANLYTYSGVLPMSGMYTDHLDKALGFTGASKLIEDKGIAALADELKKRRQVAKGTDKPDAPVIKEAQDWTPLLEELLEVADNQQKEIADLKAAQVERETKVKAQADTLASLENKISITDKAVVAVEKAMKDFLAATPRAASNDAATRLSEAEAEAHKSKQPVEYDPAFPGMQVPLAK